MEPRIVVPLVPPTQELSSLGPSLSIMGDPVSKNKLITENYRENNFFNASFFK
jgi:hypothetical protein